MKKILNIAAIVLLTLCMTSEVSAKKYLGTPGAKAKSSSSVQRVGAAGCLPAKSSTDLDLNNVRARINTGGDMWWDLQNQPEYEIPKGSSKTAMFSASLWMGGVDVNGQLKGAFQRYRNAGNDFWTGPLTNDGKASVTADVCAEYDQHYVVYRSQIDEFRAKYGKTQKYPNYVVPDIIKDWPAHPTFPNQSYYLAPFFDNDGDGEYDYTQGDYPYYDVDNALCKPTKNALGEYEYATTAEGNGILADQVLKGDQTLWWVFNDNGNIHTETKGNAIGVEVRAQAFAFTTNDVINNMTFYTYEIINRSTFRLSETYFSQWVDTDLGFEQDDYVGCDVKRGLGYCYNGTNEDGSGLPKHYGVQPPAVGVDFFQGPYMDADGIDNPKFSPYVVTDTVFQGVDTILVHDTVIKANCDESINGVNFGDSIKDNERFGMRRFVYHNNSNAGVPQYMTDPDIAPEYYQFLRGIWKDGTKMRYGGNAHTSSGASGPECDFMFPGDTDPCNWGTGGQDPNYSGSWTEQSAPNQPGDRRFMQSAGPFTLEPGAVNYITVGIPWARAASGGAWASVELLQTVDDKCQALFDNCFKVLDGPDAPELTIQELDGELILYLENIDGSNNQNEKYTEFDPTISALNPDTVGSNDRYDSIYRFQGYQIFQLVDDETSVSEIYDVSKARLVAQCDIEDDISMVVNYVKDDKVGAMTPNIMVEGSNSGIRHSFRITEDEFATGDNKLINHKKYYYVAVAYAYNSYLEYSDDPSVIGGLYGQKTPYLAGRKSALGPIQVMTAIPHITSSEADGTTIVAKYGDGPKITRLAGKGNGPNVLKMTQESIDEIMAISESDITNNNVAPRIENPVYENGYGPIEVTVVDPLNVKAGEYRLYFNMDTVTDIAEASWILYLNGDSITSSDRTIEVANEQLMLEHGIAISISHVNSLADIDQNMGIITSSISYADSSVRWLGSVPDMDNGGSMNWIRSGSLEDASNDELSDYKDGSNFIDPDEAYERIVNGTWAPFRMIANGTDYVGPSNDAHLKASSLDSLASILVVYTPDKSKWSRCVVLEMGDDYQVNEGLARKWDVRAGQSIDKDGNPSTPGSGKSDNPDDPNYMAETGMGWFPGYVINLESGERLNVMYGEDSWLVGENGRDMMFNPTANYFGPLGQTFFGGKHALFVVGHSTKAGNVGSYDGGEFIQDILTTGSPGAKVKFFRQVMYASIPMATDQEWLNNEVKISINVEKPYSKYSWGNISSSSPVNNEWPAYKFNTGDIATQTNVASVATDALDLITVVPNPYQAFSSYEESQLDNVVKVVNLPERCTIKIYNSAGTLVRTIAKDNSMTFVEWDLKNHANIPIASGVYYFHIDAGDIGEKVVKWFGVLRPTDLNAF